MKYCEDLLRNWDVRIQFEATLLFFFSVVSGSSFVSINMFAQLNVILNFIPMLYMTAMFCWWYLCKRLVFNTEEKTRAMLVVNIIAMCIWLIISAAVSLGGWDEWGWETKTVDVPASDNVYRLMNCLLAALYILTISYDYYYKLEDRVLRIKVWALCIWIHAIVSFSYFVEWVIDAHVSGNYESIAARWFAASGCALLIIWALPIFCQQKLKKVQLLLLFFALLLYWWGSASLDCEFYADTADMTVMPGYQMLWTMALLILLESLPTMSTEIHVLGTELLIDQDLDNLNPVLPIPMADQELINVEQESPVQEEADNTVQ